MKRLTERVMYYRMAFTYACLFSINALATAIVASFMNVEWADLSQTSKFLLVVVILQNWSGTFLAFLNKTAANLEQGKPILTLDAVDVPKPTVPTPPKP